MSVIDVLKEFQGIIGTLLGVAITLFMTKWLESWGKTRYYFSKIDVTYSKKGEYGVRVTTESMAEAEFIDGEFNFEVYNGVNIVKPVKDIKALVITENNSIETDLLNADTYRVSASLIRYDKVSYINLRPNEVQGYRLKFTLSKSAFKDNKVEKITELYFIAKDVNNRTVKKMIYEG